MSDLNEVLSIWGKYVKSIENWQSLVDGVAPKQTGCGPVYELENPIPDRPNEGFAIVDMRQIDISEPHKHINGDTEIYFVIQGTGKAEVGNDLFDMQPDSVIITKPNTIHIVVPRKDLVIAAVNTPPFNPENYVVLDKTDQGVAKMIVKLRAES
jgi:mannose-6-phosphate isomerase-like protein (cupin superfamily)